MSKALYESPPSESALRTTRRRRALFWGLAVLALLGSAIKLYLEYGVAKPVQFYRISPDTKFHVSGPGLLDATDRVVISAQIEGRLNSLKVDRNDVVKAGQLLATIDAEEIANQLVALRADAAAAEEHVAEARSEKARADSVYQKVAADLQRSRSLASRGITSQSELSAAEALFQEAKADLDRNATSITRASAQARSSSALQQATEARLANATLRSPLDGVVVSRDPNVGDFVRPGQKILEIVAPRSIVVSARFDESVMGQVEKGQPAKVRFVSEPSTIIDGSVLELHRIVDQETREFTVDISIAALPKNWALGQRAMVQVEVKNYSHSLLAPINFLARREGHGGLWFYKEGRVHWRAVTIGYSVGGFVEIVSGVARGDVIVPPQGRYEYESVSLAAEPLGDSGGAAPLIP